MGLITKKKSIFLRVTSTKELLTIDFVNKNFLTRTTPLNTLVQHFEKSIRNLEEVFAGTVPANKEYFAGTVPAKKEYAAGQVH